MRWFCSVDKHLDKAPKWLYSAVGFIAKLTLEIYVVQYVLIEIVRNFGLFFPLNWAVLTALIVMCAFVLHIAIEFSTKAVKMAIKKF